MKKITLIIIIGLFVISCSNKNKIEKKTTIEEDALEFCKLDIKIKSNSPSSIKYDTLLSEAFEVKPDIKYYNKLLDDVQGITQINDSVSKKWQVSIYYEDQNKHSSMIKNNVTYILRENDKYKKDSLFEQKFTILSIIDVRKANEYLGVE